MRALRTTCTRVTRQRRSPLARAVATKSAPSTSSMPTRRLRIEHGTNGEGGAQRREHQRVQGPPKAAALPADGEPVQVQPEEDAQRRCRARTTACPSPRRRRAHRVVAGAILVRGRERGERHRDDDREETGQSHQGCGDADADAEISEATGAW